MLRIIVIIVVAAIVLVGGVALAGLRLPVAHVATRSAVIPAPPDSVFAAITDFAAAPTWRPGLKRVDVEPLAGGRLRFTEVSGTGPMTMEVEHLEPPTRLVTRIVGEGLPFGGAWAYAVTPEGSGSRVTISEHGEVYNPVFRFISRYVMGHATTIETYLKALGAKYGATVSPVDAAPVSPG
jgi:uncharacterized protein YndB with AHSA1/START domain